MTRANCSCTNFGLSSVLIPFLSAVAVALRILLLMRVTSQNAVVRFPFDLGFFVAFLAFFSQLLLALELFVVHEVAQHAQLLVNCHVPNDVLDVALSHLFQYLGWHLFHLCVSILVEIIDAVHLLHPVYMIHSLVLFVIITAIDAILSAL